MIRSRRAASTALCTLLAAQLLTACDVRISFGSSDATRGSGVEATETRRLEAFDEVRFAGEGRLEITLGADPSVELSGDDNLLPLVRTEVDGDELVIRPSEPIDPRKDLVVRVSAPSLKRLDCSGSGAVEVRDVDEEDLVVGLAGAARLELAGTVDRFELDLSGVGKVHAEDLSAREVQVRVSGVGQARVRARERLEARVSGIGRVLYSGDPEVEKNISGLGMVSRAD